MSSIVERMQELADRHGVKITPLSVHLGMHNSSVSEWKKGKSQPSLKAVMAFAEYFDVSLDYLVYGREWSGNRDVLKLQLGISSKSDEELLEKYHQLPPELQQKALGFIEGMLSISAQSSSPNTKEEQLSV